MPRGVPKTVGTAEQMRPLVTLREAGCSMAEIGRRLGLTKNQVIGRLYRAGVPGGSAAACGKTDAAPSVAPTECHAAAPVPGPGYHESGCKWIEGDPRMPGFRYCGENVMMPGNAWCEAHYRRVYVPGSASRIGAE